MRRWLSALTLSLCIASPALATSAKKQPGSKAPPCNIAKLTPSYTKSLAADQLKETAIVAGSSYYTAPCFRATVDFLIAPKDPGLRPYQDFFFDSIGNELVDTQEKCQTYKQSTEIYKLNTNGNWTQTDKGRILGHWSSGKCKFKPPTGQNDFRTKKYSPVYQQQTHYRIVSTVTTGEGIVWGPLNQPSNTSAVEAKALGQAVPRGVCFAVEHPHSDNTQVEGCADPTR
jgi:hypothetical protein